MAFATPMPTRSPRMRRHSSARSVALVGELDGLLAVGQAALLRERVQPAAGAERLERRGLRRASAARRARRPTRSALTI